VQPNVFVPLPRKNQVGPVNAVLNAVVLIAVTISLAKLPKVSGMHVLALECAKKIQAESNK
jgi:hypothetical protein